MRSVAQCVGCVLGYFDEDFGLENSEDVKKRASCGSDSWVR